MRADTLDSQWSQPGQTDVIAALREHPSLLRNRSLLMNLVIDEYAVRRHALHDLNLDNHCRRYDQFGSSIRRSIQRQLEVLRFIDVHGGPTQWPAAGQQLAASKCWKSLA